MRNQKKSDGFRILVDKLWPRGVKKDVADIDLWLKEIAPSDTLRKWFNHDAHAIREKARQQKITLLFASKETEHNNAVALLNVILNRTGSGDSMSIKNEWIGSKVPKKKNASNNQ